MQFVGRSEGEVAGGALVFEAACAGLADWMATIALSIIRNVLAILHITSPTREVLMKVKVD